MARRRRAGARRARAARALIAAARPVAVNGEDLTLAFASTAQFLKKSGGSGESHGRREALQAVTGGRWRLSFELRDEPHGEDQQPDERSEEEWVKRFMEEFDAEEIPGERGPGEHEGARQGRGAGAHEQRERRLMGKQPRMPNVAQMMQQVQKMQKDMELAQEQLKNEVVEASAGGGMVTVKVSGDLEVRTCASTLPPSTRRTWRSSPTWCSPPPTRRCAARRSSPPRGWAAPPQAWTSATWAGWACRACEQHLLRPARPAAGHGALEAAGRRHPHRSAPSLSHPARLAGRCGALAQAIREVKERIRLCEVCFNLTDETRCRICQDTRRDHGLLCVVEEPSDVIPMERTHEYHGVYHVLGGALSPIDGIDPEDLKIAELLERVAVANARCARSCSRRTHDDGRGDRPAHRRGAAASERRRSPSRGWPAAYRSAPISNTPTR